MKAVLISIQPKWCELIANGKKTVEVRKTKPKLETPFKVYIYCTKGETIYLPRDIFGNEALNGKVIGEFVCNCVVGVKCDNGYQAAYNRKQNTCLSDEEIMQYAKNGKVYYWHISDLVIYDKPKELYEFKKPCDKNCDKCDYLDVQEIGAYEHTREIKTCLNLITRPPQSWCYVERLGEG